MSMHMMGIWWSNLIFTYTLFIYFLRTLYIHQCHSPFCFHFSQRYIFCSIKPTRNFIMLCKTISKEECLLLFRYLDAWSQPLIISHAENKLHRFTSEKKRDENITALRYGISSQCMHLIYKNALQKQKLNLTDLLGLLIVKTP